MFGFKPEKKFDLSNHNLVLVLILGVMLLVFGILELPGALTFRSDLVARKGTLRTADIYVNTVTDNHGHESQKSELIFYLNEFRQKYYLAENIGNEHYNENFGKIRAGLMHSDSVTVWIKKDEVEEFEPKVFQIDNNYKTLLELETVTREKGQLVGLFFVLGILLISTFLWTLYPEKFKRLFSE